MIKMGQNIGHYSCTPTYIFTVVGDIKLT